MPVLNNQGNRKIPWGLGEKEKGELLSRIQWGVKIE